ncbi:glycerol-3-phosphate 1-O-acyltransferase PlsY [Alicyclobacillus tolerans]|uniref:Glycerol-3-phosphate acyltransferase n=2 Tax=Alicyclobacillus tolerans TaxID=90970 RepID=A0ABT9M004_9BACL|nr:MULTISPECIES: glycerol-3-phosphate 1-O-acyltransferase PlsY [Alicyclobacillus]MDP9729845.1 glycerol-3-phosphate acyltransferase PlsY [Alicyclobacillus tengchongensis]QRF23327.1 glycerol-3-phosphate 1-O-acyltransferase PlsY [Alicyclobacillus sp. TC]SHL03723.1 glycerol-3-phosphate acyltransferase PlsY [Alicyclobacillus montanus]
MGWLAILIAYLLGSISVSTLMVKAVKKVDIRNYGSGNAGATNTLRLLGWKYGVLVLLLDAFKGVLAVWIANLLGHGQPIYDYLSGLSVILGHNWPLYFGFRGGKGIATTIGVFLCLLPLATLISGFIAIVIIFMTRYVSLGAIVFVVLSPIFLALLSHKTGALLFASIAAVLAIIRHRENLIRLVQGRERKLFDHHA